ncbi:MAG: hypothetical protein VYB98_06540 [Actinomycetota bacterium]|nr:hypothetical protein [Actinomycetota bacterium]
MPTHPITWTLPDLAGFTALTRQADSIAQAGVIVVALFRLFAYPGPGITDEPADTVSPRTRLLTRAALADTADVTIGRFNADERFGAAIHCIALTRTGTVIVHGTRLDTLTGQAVSFTEAISIIDAHAHFRTAARVGIALLIAGTATLVTTPILALARFVAETTGITVGISGAEIPLLATPVLPTRPITHAVKITLTAVLAGTDHTNSTGEAILVELADGRLITPAIFTTDLIRRAGPSRACLIAGATVTNATGIAVSIVLTKTALAAPPILATHSRTVTISIETAWVHAFSLCADTVALAIQILATRIGLDTATRVVVAGLGTWAYPLGTALDTHIIDAQTSTVAILVANAPV